MVTIILVAADAGFAPVAESVKGGGAFCEEFGGGLEYHLAGGAFLVAIGDGVGVFYFAAEGCGTAASFPVAGGR